jgi:hypothetical protein
MLHRPDWVPIDAQAVLQAESIIRLTETLPLGHGQLEVLDCLHRVFRDTPTIIRENPKLFWAVACP